MHRITAALALAALAACGPDRGPDQAPAAPPPNISAGSAPAAPASKPDAARPPAPGPQAPVPAPILGEEIARVEWAKAANRAECAPLALASDGGGIAIDGVPRRAQFSGGWAVAFDLPGRRSAFGFAGPGLLPADRAGHSAGVVALERQWPYLRRWGEGENLPVGSAAGYGVMGAEPYPESNPAGRGLHSLAYVRVPGQACQYNAWSRIGRAHLETMLGLLRLIGSDERPR